MADFRIDWQKYSFGLLCVLSLIPVLVFKYLPAVDLPNHIYAALLHAREVNHGVEHAISAHWVASPYILYHLLMYIPLKLFGWSIASKIVLSLYVLLLPIGASMVVREFNPDNRILAFLAFPFIYSYHFEYGFLPYVIGIPFVLIGIAIFNRCVRKGFTPQLVVLSALVSIIIYLSHFINFGAYAVGVLIILMYNLHRLRSSSSGIQWLRVLKLILIFVPVTVVFAVYLFEAFGAGMGGALSIAEFDDVFHQFTSGIRVLFATEVRVDAIRVGLLALLVVVLFLSNRKILQLNLLSVFGAATWILAFVLPRKYFLGGAELSSRFAVFGILALLLSLQLGWRKFEKTVVLFVLLVLLVGTAYRIKSYGEIDRLTGRYVESTLETIPSGSNILTIQNGFRDSYLPYMQHSIAYYHVEKGGYSPFLFADQPMVAGIEANIELPWLSEEWHPDDARGISEVLPHYDYIVILNNGNKTPDAFSTYADLVVFEDELTTILDLRSLD